jgi:protein-S-isoprenylcysteine O-methyltransferase Ste14
MLDTMFKALWLAGSVMAFVMQAVYASRLRQVRIVDDRNRGLDKLLTQLPFLGALVIPIIYLVTSWLDFADYSLPTSASLVAGLAGAVVFAVGLWLLWRSHADLRHNWLPLQVTEGQSLVTEGAFRYVRHPMYAGYLLWAIAQALLLQNWIAGLATLASMLPVYLVRIPREGQMMLDHFGDEYREYMKRTGRLFPRLGR